MSSVLGFGDFFYFRNKVGIEYTLTLLRKCVLYILAKQKSQLI